MIPGDGSGSGSKANDTPVEQSLMSTVKMIDKTQEQTHLKVIEAPVRQGGPLGRGRGERSPRGRGLRSPDHN